MPTKIDFALSLRALDTSNQDFAEDLDCWMLSLTAEIMSSIDEFAPDNATE